MTLAEENFVNRYYETQDEPLMTFLMIRYGFDPDDEEQREYFKDHHLFD